MKTSNLTLVLIGLMAQCSCSSLYKTERQRLERTIPYILPDTVANLLEKEVHRRKGNVYFFLRKRNDGTFSIYPSDPKQVEFWISRTNRKVFVKGKYYPLLFDYDMEWATTSTASELLGQYQAGEYLTYKIKYVIYEGVHIDFKRDGEIINR